MSHNKILGYFGVALTIALGVGILIPAAKAEVLYDREGIQLQGTARIASQNAATCNVLEEKCSPEEYEKLKANQGQPLHVWQLDISAHNRTGKALDFLRADFTIDSPWPPCTNWSGEGSGGGPAGDFVDAEGHPRPVQWAGTLKVLSRVGGMRVGEVERDTAFLPVFHKDKPVFKDWQVYFTFPGQTSQGRQAAAAPQSREAPPRAAARQRVELPPEILADKYLRQAEQLVREKDYEGARQALEKLEALQQEHGLEPDPEDHFRYARIWSEAGAPERAMEEAVRYLQIRGREAEHYEEALDLINRAEGEQARAESGAGAPSGAPTGSSGIRVGETVAFDGMEFVGIPPGEFLMGSTSRHADDDEKPVTQVRISQGFYLGKTEVTQDQWQAVMGNNPSRFSGCGRCPVERVSWEDAQVFIGRLNARSGGERYRLPTEAEWEYAARAGTTTDTYAGDVTNPFGNDPVVNGIAWYDENSGGRTHPAGQKAPNGFGLYDMLGNVWEWVGDWYGSYPGGAVTDPAGPGPGSYRVDRGGGWDHYARSCRSAIRNGYSPGYRGLNLGFRLLRTE